MAIGDFVRVAAYDVETKKLAYIFANIAVCSEYLMKFGNGSKVAAIVRYKVVNKKRCYSDILGKEFALRVATKQQEEMIGGEYVLCFNGHTIKLNPKHTRGAEHLPPLSKYKDVFAGKIEDIRKMLHEGQHVKAIAEAVALPEKYIRDNVCIRRHRPPRPNTSPKEVLAVKFNRASIDGYFKDFTWHLSEGSRTYCGKKLNKSNHHKVDDFANGTPCKY